MNRYLIITYEGTPQIIYGSWLKACAKCKDGFKVKVIPKDISADDIIYGRVTYDDL